MLQCSMYIGYASLTFLKLAVTLHLIHIYNCMALITHTDYRGVNMIISTKSVTIYFSLLSLLSSSFNLKLDGPIS